MDESQEPRSSGPKGPAKPLPRLWKHTPDEDELREQREREERAKKAASGTESDAGPPREKPRTRKKPEKDKPPKPKGALIEETPNLDTYETRQRARILIGAVLLCVVVTTGFLIYRVFAPAASTEEQTTDTGLLATVPGGAARSQLEPEARVLLERAQESARKGNTAQAVTMLQKVVASYPATPSAAEAREALARPKRNLPLFLDRPAVVAGSATAPSTAPAATEGPPVVVAAPTQVAAARGAEARLELPANPAEPAVGLPSTPPTTATDRPSRPLPKGFHPRPGTPVHASGWPSVIVGDRDGAPLVLVPGGTFTQGRDGADPAEAPEHKARVSTYYVDQHEVTVGQFKLYQKEAGRRSDRDRALAREPSTAALDTDDASPVVMVSARDAADYAAWAGKRLPTEAQWEAAARGTDGRPFPWGNTPATPTDRKTRPVMTDPNDRSPFGAFDLGGNAWEWTKDWFDPHYYELFRSTVADDPTGPSNRPRSQQLVVKGGSKEGMAAHRTPHRFDTRLPFLGFRCVLQVEGPGNAFEAATTPAPTGPAGGGGGSGTVVPF